MKDSLFVIIPAYNERENIKNVIDAWYPLLHNVSDGYLVVINDGSKDDTLVTLYHLAENRKKLIVLSKENGGHGDTLLFGYKYAIEQGADWIFQTDSDGQTRAEEFPEFWNNRETYDAILGNRKRRGDGISRLCVEKVLCLLLRCMFGIRVPDANCPFRLMRADKVSEYVKRLPEHYFLPNVMLTVFFVKNNDRVAFKEITFENRKAGKNSINMKKIFHIGIQSINDFKKFRREM